MIELFVPGRVCLFGEHSDWVGGYRRINSAIKKGYAIIAPTDQGLYASARKSEELIYRSDMGELRLPMDINALMDVAKEGGIFSYIAGTALETLIHYDVGGVSITNYKTDLPIKKGLSSSAAACVLVARAFNELYGLSLTKRGEMDLAYRGELATPSRCGRMDQGCAYGEPIMMTFDGDAIDVDPIDIGGEFHYLIVDLNGDKDTIKILQMLNRAYPFPEDEMKHQWMHAYFNKDNKSIVRTAKLYLGIGETTLLGDLMFEAQKRFDQLVAPMCWGELQAPLLHEVICNRVFTDHIYGGKGVGSQGDGTAQFLCRSEEARMIVGSILWDKFGMVSYPMTIGAKV